MTDRDRDECERAVTARDYECLAREATDDVKTARALAPAFHDFTHPGRWNAGDPKRFGGIDRSKGYVNVIVVPDQDNVPQPQPSRELLLEVQAYLDGRRTMTSRLAVMGPRYLPLGVTVDVVTRKEAIDRRWVKPGEAAAEVAAAIRRYLHPTRGHDECRGWKVGQDLVVAELARAIAPETRHGSISNLVVTPAIPLYHFPPLGPGGTFFEYEERGVIFQRGAPSVEVADFELVCLDEAGTVVTDKGIV
jgi:baseplate J-like protein